MMQEAARRAPGLHRRIHGAAALGALGVAAVGATTGYVGPWLTTVGTVAGALLAAEAVTCRCLLEDAVRPLGERALELVRR